MNEQPTLEHRFRAMGSPCALRLHGASRASLQTAAAAICNDVARLEARYSRYREDSLLSAINAIANTGGRIEVDAETAQLLDYAATCHRESDGLFDVTAGVLRAAWRFDRAQLPTAEEVAALRSRVGWSRLRWCSPWLEFPEPGLELDFGGIVKEYAVDRAATIAVEHGVTQGLVNLGGDVRLVGARPDGAPWRVAIAHPRRRDEALVTLSLTHGAVATSGDYERCFVVDGVRYGHLLSPRTGWPVKRLAAVTVVADLCLVAGSASTIAMLKEEEGPEWLAALGLPHLWVDTEGRLGGDLAPG
ncbi:MAG: FAD:protein FMN transferase [Gammaproteobacteria bacterium]